LDVHPVHSPIHSVRDFFLHLLTITIGILIALSLEGIVEWIHYRNLVHIAEANILNEIRRNQEELTKTVADMKTTKQQLGHFVELVHKLESDRGTPLSDINLDWTIASLHATSWNTASATGAVAHMSYDEVERYTVVYDLQQQFVAEQDRAMGSANAVLGLTTLLSKDAKKVSLSELENAERTIGLALAETRMREEIAVALNREYSKFGQPK
jgi:hypothetical protein